MFEKLKGAYRYKKNFTISAHSLFSSKYNSFRFLSVAKNIWETIDNNIKPN